MLSLLNGLWYGPAAVALTDHLVEDEQTAPTDSEVRFRLNSSGVAQSYTTTDAAYTDISGEWLASGLNSDFESRATLLTGTLTSGTTGTWQVLSTSREWTVAFTGANGNKECSFTLEIRRVSDSVVVATATITLRAVVTP